MFFRIIARSDKTVDKNENDEILTEVTLEDTRWKPDPLPLEVFNLKETVEDKKYVKVEILSHFGQKGGLDYFDILRLDPYKISDDAKSQCIKKTSDCLPKLQFCSKSECIPDTIVWQDKNHPNLLQKGCSTISKTTLFDKSAKCVLKTAVKENQMGPIVIDTTDSTKMGDCTTWTETEPCSKEILSTVNPGEKDKIKIKHFKLSSKGCSEGVNIALFDITTKKTTGKFLSYLEIENSSVEVGTDKNCFRIHHGLCGANSIGFESLGGLNLFLTKCEGYIVMKREYDYCGYLHLHFGLSFHR